MKNDKTHSQDDEHTIESDESLEIFVEVDEIDENEYRKHFSIESGHVDPERVFLAAVGELQLRQDENIHLDDCVTCSKHLALWQGSAETETSPSGPKNKREFFSVAPLRLAASSNETVAIGDWTVCNSPSKSEAQSTNPTVLRVERDVSAIGDETVVIRLDWQDERGRVLGSSLGVLDRSLPVVTDDGVRTRVRIAEVSVPNSIASVPGVSLTNVKLVNSLDDIGVSAIECLEHSMTQSLNLGLTKWNAWANAVERILGHSPKVSDEVEAMVRLILAACQSQGENKEGLKRFKSVPSCRLEWRVDLFATGNHRANRYDWLTAPASLLPLGFLFAQIMR